MSDEELLQGLESLVTEHSLEVRYEKGDFLGGLYRYKNEEQIVINKDLPIKQKIKILANELNTKLDLESLYLVPALREVIENASRLGQ
jgi:hypothetical protein